MHVQILVNMKGLCPTVIFELKTGQSTYFMYRLSCKMSHCTAGHKTGFRELDLLLRQLKSSKMFYSS